jgi:hypothetical protein
MKRAVPLLMVLALAGACDGEPSHAGLEESLRVPGAFFREGALPGTPVDELPDDPEELEAISPRVPGVSPATGTVRPGQASVGLRGTVTEDAFSIALRLDDQSSGYWVKAVGSATPTPNEREWDARLDFSPDITPGEHVLEIVAIDGNGHAGAQTTFTFCVTRDVEHSRNACDPTVLPPASIISLSWESDADVDLVVVTPSGVTVDATHPSTLDLEGGEDVDPLAPGVGLLSIDSNGACRRDGVQRETLSWLTSPERGQYQVYAKLFEACDAGATPLKVEAFVRTAGEDEGTYGLALAADTVHGLILPTQAVGAKGRGTFITTIEFP